ncbi:importin subunit alpha-9 [Tasmannia lanceolata]|uniref:importin subunit alpha-9 n=1 Tax=Tasmannia lanceolata TaxID=3420 RepID=UPI0040643515
MCHSPSYFFPRASPEDSSNSPFGFPLDSLEAKSAPNSLLKKNPIQSNPIKAFRNFVHFKDRTMADEGLASHRRDPVKSPVGNIAAQRRRQNAVTVGKERREALVRTKRLCRDGLANDSEVSLERDMIIDEEQVALDAQTSSAVEELKSAVLYQGKGATQKKVEALRDLRRLLSKSEIPPVGAALQAGAIPVLVQCLSFGSSDEQLLEAAWCLTNIAAGEPEQTKALLPALPLLIAHLGEKSSMPVAEQCAWALGNVAGEGEELRSILLVQGALPPLARMMLSNKGSTARTAAWSLSNLIKGPDPKGATELIRIDGVLDVIVRHLRKGDEELATEVAWVVVYLSALSNTATGILVKSDIVQLLVGRLAASDSLQLLIPVLRSLGNLVAGDSYTTYSVLLVGHDITDSVISALVKCLKSDHRVLKKEAAWVLSNIAAGSIAHKQLIFSSEAIPMLMRLLSTAPFDIKKEVAYAVGNLCVAPTEGSRQPNIILEHLISLVGRGCLPGFINLVRSPDIEAARLGLQFLELVMRGLPNGEGPKLVEREDGIDAMERFQFHENEDLRNMANGLVDKYFGEDYGLDE